MNSYHVDTQQQQAATEPPNKAIVAETNGVKGQCQKTFPQMAAILASSS